MCGGFNGIRNGACLEVQPWLGQVPWNNADDRVFFRGVAGRM